MKDKRQWLGELMALAAWMSGPRSSSACKGMKGKGWHLETDVAIAWAIPLVVGIVWSGGRMLRRRLHS